MLLVFTFKHLQLNLDKNNRFLALAHNLAVTGVRKLIFFHVESWARFYFSFSVHMKIYSAMMERINFL